jgi:hypothetical protein
MKNWWATGGDQAQRFCLEQGSFLEPGREQSRALLGKVSREAVVNEAVCNASL